MKTIFTKFLPVLVAILLSSVNAKAVDLADLLPMQEGYVVVTCSTGPNDTFTGYALEKPVVGIFNTSQTALDGITVGVPSATYPWQAFHNEEIFQDVPSASETWTGANLGEVFGLTLDDQLPPNIYVSASIAYVKGILPEWPAGESAGSVYRLDGVTGEITSCVQLPSSSDASLGNLCFYRDVSDDGWIYVSNLDDGYVYRVSESSCTVVNMFEHPTAPADDGLDGLSPYGRRIWGLAVHDGRLFYALWNDGTVTNQEIWSVGLTASGDFDLGSEMLEVLVHEYVGGINPPVSDIEFGEDGAMYVSERSFGDVYIPHNARVLKFTGSSGSYVPSPEDMYVVGSLFPGDNSGGGVAVECSGRIWVTSNWINDGPFIAYGLQSIMAGGNFADVSPYENSYIVDYDGVSGQEPKGDFGEADIWSTQCDCILAAVSDIICPEQPGSDYSVALDITNISGKIGANWAVTPCPAAELPPGAVTLGTSFGEAFSPLLGDGETQTVSIGIPSSFAGDTVCFNLSIVDSLGIPCCTIKVCVGLPNCDCLEAIAKEIECVRQEDGSVKWNLTITVMNNAGWDAHYVSLLPLPGSSMAPVSAVPDGDVIPDGGTGPVTVCIESDGAPVLMEGDALCFSLVLHSEDISVCCSEVCCVRLPDCFPSLIDDACVLSRHVVCCPGTNTATVYFTICNNSMMARTYVWDIESLFGCSVMLPPGAYSPGGGSIAIPAETCQTIPIAVNCNALKSGDCGAFAACFQQINPAGPEICCKGTVYVPNPGEIVFKQAFPNDVSLPWGEVGILKFIVSNPGTTPISTNVFFQSDLGAIDFGQGTTGSGYVLPVSLAAGEEKCIELMVQLHPRIAQVSQRYFPFQVSAQGRVLTTSVVFSLPNTGLSIVDIEVKKTENRVRILVKSERGKRYQLQTGDLDGWANALPEFAGSDAPVVLVLDRIQGDLQHFYRVVEMP
jgi:hypothetical protein